VIDIDQTPAINVLQTGECSYDMSLILPGLETEQRELLFGVSYVTTDYPSGAGLTFLEGDAYFIPRCAAIQFFNLLTGDRSSSIQLNNLRGYVVNPDRLAFDRFEVTPYTGAYVIDAQSDSRTVQVATDVVIPRD